MLADRQPFAVKDHAVRRSTQNVLPQRDVVGRVVSRVNDTEFIYRNDVTHVQTRYIHSKHLN